MCQSPRAAASPGPVTRRHAGLRERARVSRAQCRRADQRRPLARDAVPRRPRAARAKLAADQQARQVDRRSPSAPGRRTAQGYARRRDRAAIPPSRRPRRGPRRRRGRRRRRRGVARVGARRHHPAEDAVILEHGDRARPSGTSRRSRSARRRRSPICCGCRAARSAAARCRRGRPSAIAPRICVSSPRITSGTPAASMQVTPGTMASAPPRGVARKRRGERRRAPPDRRSTAPRSIPGGCRSCRTRSAARDRPPSHRAARRAPRRTRRPRTCWMPSGALRSPTTRPSAARR